MSRLIQCGAAPCIVPERDVTPECQRVPALLPSKTFTEPQPVVPSQRAPFPTWYVDDAQCWTGVDVRIGHDGGGGGAACVNTLIVSTCKKSLPVYKNAYRAVPVHETVYSCPFTAVPGTEQVLTTPMSGSVPRPVVRRISGAEPPLQSPQQSPRDFT